MARNIKTLILAALAALGFNARGKKPLLPANGDTFRIVLERRAAYAKACPDQHVDFSQYARNRSVGGVTVNVIRAGVIEVPSGSLVVADPFYLADAFTKPFQRAVPPGEYEVTLSLVDFAQWGQRVAFVFITVSNRKVDRWEIAETTDDVSLNQFFGVDAGLASFSDSQTAEVFADALRKFQAEQPQGNYYEDVLSAELPPHSSWCVYRPDPTSRLSTVITSSGLGDGLYSSYWGIDENGEVAQLVTDFQLFDRSGPIVQS